MSNQHPIHDKLKSIPLFHNFKASEIDEFLDLADPTAFKAGEMVVRQGDSGSCMFYIAEGKCRVVAKRGGDLVELAQLGPGEIVGELALFDHHERSADVQAVTDSVLLKVNEGVLSALAGVYPQAAFKFLLGILREIGERIRKTNARYMDTLLAMPQTK